MSSCHVRIHISYSSKNLTCYKANVFSYASPCFIVSITMQFHVHIWIEDKNIKNIHFLTQVVIVYVCYMLKSVNQQTDSKGHQLRTLLRKRWIWSIHTKPPVTTIYLFIERKQWLQTFWQFIILSAHEWYYHKIRWEIMKFLLS